MRLWLNSTNITWPSNISCAIVSKAPREPATRYDYSKKNAKAISRRRGAFLGIKHKSGTEFGGTDYLFHGLREEADQLRDLLKLVGNGHWAHVRGLAARLRLLLLRDGQSPVLQTAAGAKNASLIVYTQTHPGWNGPIPAMWLNIRNISPVRTIRLVNPIDLDVWLGLPAVQINSDVISNHELIADLGNTYGSHLDLIIPASIAALRTTTTGSIEALESTLARYIIDTANSVLALCDKILDDS